MDGENLKQTEANLLSIKSDAIQKLKKLGFHKVPQPDEHTYDMPRDITKINDRELAKLFQRQMAWETYASDQLARANVTRLITEYDVELQIIKASSNFEGGVQAVKTQALRTKQVRMAKIRLKKAEAVESLMEAQFNRFTRNAQFISREQTRRATALETMR